MNILLANMPIRFNTKENLEPPLGIAYLGAVLEQAGEKVYLKDYEIDDFSPDTLEDFITSNSIDIVGVSFRTASYGSAKEFVSSIKKMRKVPILIAGGHHATAFPEYTLRDLGCDIVVRGEAEETVVKLVKALGEKIDLAKINGLTYLSKEKVTSTPPAEQITELDKVPYPSRHLLPMESYNAITILTSRGCPFACIYCDKGISTRQVKYRSPENVYKEVSGIVRKYPDKRIYFVDDHFFLAKQRLGKIFDLIEKDGMYFNWVCQARVDGVDLEILKRAKGAGCELIMFGIESGDPDELKYMRKQTTVEDAEKALIWTKKAHIRARANFMLGFPMSTHKSVRNTIRFAKSMPLEVVRFFSVAPLPNTELWDRVYGKSMDLGTVDWSKFDFYTPVYSTPELTPAQIQAYVGAAYVHVLKGRVVWELSVGFIPRSIKLFLFFLRHGRVRGGISLIFPSTVNLLLDLKAVLHSKNLYNKLKFMFNAIYLENKI